MITGTTFSWIDDNREEEIRKEKLRKERKAKIEEIFDLKKGKTII
jgi:hypothetical protein